MFGVVAALLVSLAVLVVPQTPVAAADTVVCAAKASVFAADTGGKLWLYPLNSPGSSTPTWSARTGLGGGWQIYGRVLGGPGGRIYGINSTGLYRYRWTGSAWENTNGPTRQQLSTSFTSYASAANRNKITVDERGDFYLIDLTNGNGKLRWYRYDETAKAWTIYARVIDNGWAKYDLLVAGSSGVLYARAAADGRLYRYRFDPDSQRWIDRDRLIGSGWATFSKGIFSVGGDTLFGIQGDGDLFQYRYREDNNSWPILARQIGSGWQGFTNVTATTDACHLNVSHTPPRPTMSVAHYSATTVLQASPLTTGGVGTLEYAYTDNIGRLLHGHQSDPGDFNSVQWPVISGLEAYSGTPSLVEQADGRLQVAAHNINSDIWSRTQSSAGSPGWNGWSDLGGRMVSPPAVTRLSDNTQVAFAVDAEGTLWARPQDGTNGELMAWRRLGGTGLTGAPVAVAVANTAATIFAVDAGGTVQTASYQGGTLSGWTSLGGSGFTGTPAVVVLPGSRIWVFARAADGSIQAQKNTTGGTFPGTWSTVSGLTAAGSPTALLSPASGKVEVVARDSAGGLFSTGETIQGSGQWRDWIKVQGESDTFIAASDPTAFSYSGAGGPTWAIVVRDVDNVSRLYTPTGAPALAADDDNEPLRFVGHTLPAPPAK